MGLFSFLRRRKEEEDFKDEKDYRKILSRGIYFEDTNDMIIWERPVRELSKDISVNKRIFADRTVYDWGEHVIMGGLKLSFTSVFWNHRDESRDKLFKSLEFRIAGDETSEGYMKEINSHIETLFGQPQRKDITETSESAEWLIDETRIYLYLYQQDTKKLQFEISRL